MKKLTKPQQRMLDDVRRDGERRYNGRARRTITALADAGLVTFEWAAEFSRREIYVVRPCATDRYFLRLNNEPEQEVTADEFVSAERRAGFHPKPGLGPFATAGFSAHSDHLSLFGRIEEGWRP